MNRLPVIKPDEVVRKLQSAGFEIDHITGSHYIMRHPDGRRTVVPYHAGRDIKRGVLRAIIRQAELTGTSSSSYELGEGNSYAKSPADKRPADEHQNNRQGSECHFKP
jgi:predicted RNA binding protein YcfA (HicA-like mRNA interferase family)